MDLDPSILISWLQSGAATVASTVVSETTKDAYRALKTRLKASLGTSVIDTLGKLEANPSDVGSTAQLTTDVKRLTASDKDDIQNLIIALAQAFASDAKARDVVNASGAVKLALDALGNVAISRISDAKSLEVNARADGDISITDISMARDPSPGN